MAAAAAALTAAGCALSAMAVPVASAQEEGPAQGEANAQVGKAYEFATAPDGTEYVPGEILVSYEDGAAKKKGKAEEARERGTAKVQDVTGVAALVELEDKSLRNVNEEIEELKAEPGVKDAELNAKVEGTWEPNDPRFAFADGQQNNFRQINPMGGWDIERGVEADGTPVDVAVLDTGLDASNGDICAQFTATNFCYGDTRINGQTDIVNGDNNAYDDTWGHGTAVAGIVGARTNNGFGVAGSVPQVRMYPVKVLGANVTGTYAGLAQGIAWARSKGVDVINISVSENKTTTDWNTAVADQIEAAERAGIVVVAATGNYQPNSEPNPGVGFPARHPDVLAVGASAGSTRAAFSAYGPAVDVVAPGQDIYSTRNVAPSGASFKDNLYGTSYAAPRAAALAALIKARCNCSPARVRAYITNNTVDIEGAGEDHQTGTGRIDFYNALRATPAG